MKEARRLPRAIGLLTAWLGVGMLPPAALAQAGADQVVYSDSLASGWANWSWGSSVSFSSAAPVHSGSAAIAVTYTSPWAGLYLHVDPALDASALAGLRFAIHGGVTGGQKLRAVVYDAAGAAYGSFAVLPGAGVWQQVEIPLSALEDPPAIAGLVWQDTSGGAQPTFYLDDIVLLARSGPPPPPPTPGPGPALTVDASRGRHPISPEIYGMSFADEAVARGLRVSVRRWGGNSTTRYNWQADTSNRGSDWYFENIPEDNPDPATLPDGSATDRFVEQDRRTGARTVLTMPLIGRVAKERAWGCGFSVAKYGAQQSVDPWRPDCGNGVRPGGAPITGNDPADTSAVIDPDFVRSWVEHLVRRFGTAAEGGVAFYDLDNEPELWNDTHRDAHPQPAGYDELRDRALAYAPAIKAADATAATLGPVSWGWSAYFFSALDWAQGGDWWNHPADRLAHGDVPFLRFYLRAMRAWEEEHGTRILDYLDVHFYPPGVALAPAGSAATQAWRLRSTRLLWDPEYAEESWIAEPVYLLRRLRAWIAEDYPGTRLAITEYNWGALDHINGALAQADVLGIFGREGLDLATLWGPPQLAEPGAFAFAIYRNADGAGAGFGDTSVEATSADQQKLSIYGALRAADGALTAVVINKTNTPLTSELKMAGFSPAPSAQVFCYRAAKPDAIVRGADLPVAGDTLTATFPASSITLLAFTPQPPPPAGHRLRHTLRRLAP